MWKEMCRWRLFLRALAWFDVIHFNFGRSLFGSTAWSGPRKGVGWKAGLRIWLNGLLDLQDLKALKRAGKTVVMTYQGDDARQGEVLQQSIGLDLQRELPPGYYSPGSDAYKRWRIGQVARHTDSIYALNPDLLRVLPEGARFLPYPHVNPQQFRACPPATGNPPVVLHAPTHRGIKGTRFVLEAVRRLQDEGIRFRFQLVEGLTRAEALALYPQADLLIDQLVVGWYGGLAVELMAMAKPVICFIRQDDLAFIPTGMREELPIIRASHLDLYQVLKEWLTVRRHQLGQQGERSRGFVERWHDPHQIASAVIRDYRRARSRK
jgi:hypothetical protein